MAKCGVCGLSQNERVISGIPMCKECFAKLQKLRAGDWNTINYFADENNLSNATSEAKKYFQELLDDKKELIELSRKENERQQELVKQEEERREYANSFNDNYEYDVVTVLNVNQGQVDKVKIVDLLNSMAKKGWKLHTVYSNELGKNAVGILGFGVNATVCEDVFIFERRVKELK